MSIAENHWHAANELKKLYDHKVSSQTGHFRQSLEGASIISLYYAALECWVNFKLGDEKRPTDASWHRRMHLIQDDTGYRKFKAFLDEFNFSMTDDFDRDVRMFCDVRNCAYHDSPEFGPVNEGPYSLGELVRLLGIKEGFPIWTAYLGHPCVVAWCGDVVRNFIRAYDRKTGKDDTFSHPIYDWDRPT